MNVEVSLEMNSIKLDLADDMLTLLQQLNQPVEQAALELMVLELYRRGAISSGKAAQLLKVSRLEFIQYASSLDIPYFAFNEEELEAEIAQSKLL
jgi:predicted HTH domain antitoxin